MSDNHRSWGQFVEEVADERALDLFEGVEPYTTAELAEELDTTEHTARNKLELLREDGKLERKVLRGGEAPLTVWYRPRGTLGELAAEGDGEDADDDDGISEAEIDEAIEELDVPGTSGMMRDWRRDAVRAAYDHLSEHGTVPVDTFHEEVYPGYAAGYDDPQAWWAMVRERLKELPGVVGPGWDGQTWEYEQPE